MTNYTAARLNMVEGQIRPNKVRDLTLIDAMTDVPREMFVPQSARGFAYIDEDIQVGSGRYLLEPMVLARMINDAEVGREDKVLDIAPATGYSTALLSRLARRVTAVESDAELARQAMANLHELGCTNTAVVQQPLTHGYPASAPYDVILINGAVAEVPKALLDQLADGGRLIAVVVGSGGVGQAKLYTRVVDTISDRTLFEAGARRLPDFDPAPRFVF